MLIVKEVITVGSARTVSPCWKRRQNDIVKLSKGQFAYSKLLIKSMDLPKQSSFSSVLFGITVTQRKHVEYTFINSFMKRIVEYLLSNNFPATSNEVYPHIEGSSENSGRTAYFSMTVMIGYINEFVWLCVKELSCISNTVHISEWMTSSNVSLLLLAYKVRNVLSVHNCGRSQGCHCDKKQHMIRDPEKPYLGGAFFLMSRKDRFTPRRA